MNNCMHCGFIGEPEEFTTKNVCNRCRKNQKSKNQKSNKKYYERNRERISTRRKKRYEINTEYELEENEKYRRKKGILPWTEIKNLRLGLYIEQTIASMFGSVTEPYNTPDIDFICPNGYKIQVKAASINYKEGKYPNWQFKIKKNKVVDYFILVAVNNSDDINKENFKPEHIWMMKGSVLNNKTGVSISLSKVSKWNKHSIMEEYENKFITCCAKIKKPEL